MVWLLYYSLMYVMVAGIHLSSLWSEKSNSWVSGRRKWKKQLSLMPPKTGPRIWFHVSSLGEFEQARPVIEKIKQRNSKIEIILTFFSPSGFLIRSGYPHANVSYLPADLPGNANTWINAVRPDMAVFVKYDLWPGYLKNLQDKGIPTVLISAHWIPGAWFSSRNIPPTRSLIRNFNKIFLQTEDNLLYFKEKEFNNLSASGDTRIDRCLELPAESVNKIPASLLALGPFDLVAGSTWPADEKLLMAVILDLKLKVLIAPHDISEANISRLIKSVPSPILRLSELKESKSIPDIIIVDSIGLLSVLYTLGKLAYVGGGFGAGIHNTLEPMAHGKPLIFGPRYNKFPEAVEMVKAKAAWTVRNANELRTALISLQQPGISEKAGKIARDYLGNHAGASDKVANYLLESLYLAASKYDNDKRNQSGR